MAFEQGISALNSFDKQLDVIGNNISNASTVGFKRARAEFQDMFMHSRNLGGSNLNVGYGTKVGNVKDMYNQGNITTTKNPFDIAINGEGFFRVESGSGDVHYSRDGEFTVDKNGFIRNNNYDYLMGYASPLTGNATGTPQRLQLSVVEIPAQATSMVEQGVNLDSGAKIVDRVTRPFDPRDQQSFSWMTASTIFDSAGDSHVFSTYYTKVGVNQWEAHIAIDDSTEGLPNNGKIADLNFSELGLLDTINGAPASANSLNLTIPGAALGNGAASVSFTYNIASSTQYAIPMSNQSQFQNGYSRGELMGFGVDENGIIQAQFSNGMTRPQGQVAIANFTNVHGLERLGNNNFLATRDSGPELLGYPGQSELYGMVRSLALEDSNVDLSVELVDMIVAQRNYQVNSQSIKTQDAFYQALIGIR